MTTSHNRRLGCNRERHAEAHRDLEGEKSSGNKSDKEGGGCSSTENPPQTLVFSPFLLQFTLSQNFVNLFNNGAQLSATTMQKYGSSTTSCNATLDSPH
jgi:hypothetical protein